MGKSIQSSAATKIIVSKISKAMFKSLSAEISLLVH